MSPSPLDDPFARHAWTLQLAGRGVFEAATYNLSHEDLFGIVPGMTYAPRDGWMITAAWPLHYVYQRGIDGYSLGATIGVRRRLHRGARLSIFAGVDGGISEADTRVPPGGTRFNYLAIVSAGGTVRLRRGVHLIAALELLHLSNANLAGLERNPDIEATGMTVGVLVGF